MRYTPKTLRITPSLLYSVSGLLLVASLSFGQSFFNARALGEVIPPADARLLGLGSPSALSYRNPGILVNLSKTSFGLSVLASGAVGSQAGQARIIGTARPAGFNAAVPLPRGTRLILGVEERFGQDFDLWSDSLPDSSCRFHVVSRGGIHALRAGLGYSLFGIAGLGFEYNRITGASREDWQINVGNGRYSSTDTVELSYAGNALRLGTSLQTSKYALGICYSLPQRLTATSLRKVHGVVEDSLLIHRISVPWDISLGISVTPSEPLTAALGVDYRPWSDITVDTASLPGARNSLRASLGLEYHTDRFPLRLAYSYEPWYYSTRNSSAIVEHRLHLGCGIPIQGFGSLEFAAGLGRRISAELTETSASLMLNLAYHEAWLKRTRRWGY